MTTTGSIALFKGYVTTFAATQGKSSSQLERLLGFSDGSLSAGFQIYALLAPVGKGEFEWKDRTTYSDGWHYDPSIGEFVQRRDELRAHFAKATNWSEQESDQRLDAFMEEQRRYLNVRTGPGRIVKLLPLGRVAAFPDSPVRNVPQWKLLVTKPFSQVR